MCSMISEQVNSLRTIANSLAIGHNIAISDAVKKFREAADTIEALSAKLSAANMERSERYYGGGWIYCGDGENLPENNKYDWVLAQIQEDNGYLWIPKVMEYRESKNDWYSEELGWLSKYNGAFKVVAWQPLPSPYMEDKE